MRGVHPTSIIRGAAGGEEMSGSPPESQEGRPRTAQAAPCTAQEIAPLLKEQMQTLCLPQSVPLYSATEDFLDIARKVLGS